MNRQTLNKPTKNSLLRERDAADILSVKDSTLQKWRYLGCGPKYIRVGGANGRAVRYRENDLQAYIASNVVDTLDSNGVA